jgi:hypothetical protein
MNSKSVRNSAQPVDDMARLPQAVGDLDHVVSNEIGSKKAQPTARQWTRSFALVEKYLSQCAQLYKSVHDLMPSLEAAYVAKDATRVVAIEKDAKDRLQKARKCVRTIDFSLPQNADEQLIVGAIFAEAKTGGRASDDEMLNIGLAVRNMAYYSALTDKAGKKCNNGSFGNGTIEGVIEKSIEAYKGERWTLVMTGNALKSKTDLEKSLNDIAEIAQLKRVVAAARKAVNTTVPAGDPITGKIPLQFNQALISPPSGRAERIFNYGVHTFYGFIKGRECW